MGGRVEAVPEHAARRRRPPLRVGRRGAPCRGGWTADRSTRRRRGAWRCGRRGRRRASCRGRGCGDPRACRIPPSAAARMSARRSTTGRRRCDRGEDAGGGELLERDTHRRELALHDGRGCSLRPHQFGRQVELATDADDVVRHGRCVGEDRRGSSAVALPDAMEDADVVRDRRQTRTTPTRRSRR